MSLNKLFRRRFICTMTLTRLRQLNLLSDFKKVHFFSSFLLDWQCIRSEVASFRKSFMMRILVLFIEMPLNIPLTILSMNVPWQHTFLSLIFKGEDILNYLSWYWSLTNSRSRSLRSLSSYIFNINQLYLIEHPPWFL